MINLNEDPIMNIIYNGIKRDIQIAVDNDCHMGAVILVYCGIDTMAYLSMPEDRESAKRFDFIKWANYYIKFPCKEQLTGEDLYGARCAVLHTYSTESDLSRQGKCRIITYMDEAVPEINYAKDDVEDLVMVSVKGLAEAFFKGINESLIDIFKSEKKSKVTNDRLNMLIKKFPHPRSKRND